MDQRDLIESVVAVNVAASRNIQAPGSATPANQQALTR
jgi:hypothetical protein